MALKIVTVLALPIALIVLLRAAPSLDARWEDQPAHFWIVLVGRRGQRRAGGGGERGRAPAQGRAAAADRARVPGQRRVPRAARARHAGRAAGEGRTPGSCWRRRSGSWSPGCSRRPPRSSTRCGPRCAIVRHARALVGAVLGAARRCGRCSRWPSSRRCARRVAPEDAEAALGAFALIGVVAYGFAAFAVLPDRGAARLQARLRDRVRLRAAGRVAGDRARLAHDELAAELVGVAPADGDQLLHDRRRRAARSGSRSASARSTSTRRSPASAR